MIDREKVIKGLELCNENNTGSQCPSCYCYPLQRHDKCIFKLHEDALALLKEREPVKPEVYFVGPDKYKFYRCPVCKIAWYHKGNYCPGCGIAVKWE